MTNGVDETETNIFRATCTGKKDITAVQKCSVSIRFKAVTVLAISSTSLLICQVVCNHYANKLQQFCLLTSTVQLCVYLPSVINIWTLTFLLSTEIISLSFSISIASVGGILTDHSHRPSVSRSVCLESDLWQNGWVDPDAVWEDEWGRSRDECIRWGWRSSKGKS